MSGVESAVTWVGKLFNDATEDTTRLQDYNAMHVARCNKVLSIMRLALIQQQVPTVIHKIEHIPCKQ